jgi:hypothetical protein
VMASLTERLFSRVANLGGQGCWPWIGDKFSGGYGRLTVDGRGKLVHRVVYQKLVGPIPQGLTIDHLCRNRACVRPSHLEPVTGRVNSLRGTGPSAQNARKTHCHKGHPLSGDNVRVTTKQRRCRECVRVYHRELWRRKAGWYD